MLVWISQNVHLSIRKEMILSMRNSQEPFSNWKRNDCARLDFAERAFQIGKAMFLLIQNLQKQFWH